MSNSKKILSIVMAVAMMLNIFAVVGFAAGPAANESDYAVDVSFATPKLTAYPGETVTITMTVGTNCYFGGATLPVFYDKNVFAVEEDSAALTGSLATYASVTSADSASEAIVWPAKLNGNSVTATMKKQYGVCNVNAYGDRYVGTVAKVLDPAEEAITLTFKIADKATVGSTGMILLEPTALRTSDAMTNKMTAYAFKTSEVNGATPNIVSLLPVNVEGAKLEIEVVASPDSSADKTGLQAAYDECGQISDASASSYITSTWTPYFVARNNASEMLADTTLTTADQDAIDAAALALREAFAGLKTAGETSDYSAIDEALAKAPSEYAQKFYTEESVNALNEVIANINWELPPTEQDVIDEYATIIENAIKNLVPDESRAKATVKLTFDKTDAEPGDEVEVKVFVGTNYAVETLEIPVFFDTNQFEFVADSLTFDSTLAKSGYGDYNASPLAAIYSRRDKTDVTWEPFWALEANAKYKAILIDWYQDGEEGHETSLEADISEAFATFKLKVKDTATDGDAKAFLCESYVKDADCMGGIFFVARDLDLDATNISDVNPVGQTYDLTTYEASCTIAATPTLIASEGSDAVIDKDKAGTYVVKGESIEVTGFVYGLEEGLTSLDGFVEATHMGDVNVEKFNDSEIGTGSIITVTKNDKTYETYIVIIFGDIDGDSYITASDGSDATLYGLGYGDDYDPYVYFAGDISVDEDINASDGSLMTLYYLGYNDIDQTTGEYIYC